MTTSQLAFDLPELTIEINGQLTTLVPRNFLRIDRSNLQDELTNQLEYYTYWGYLSGVINQKVDQLKHQRDIKAAEIDAQFRGRAVAEKAKITEKMVENQVISHPDYIDVSNAYVEAKAQAEYVRAVCVALYSRFNTLTELLKQQRGEDYYTYGAGNKQPAPMPNPNN